MDTKVEGPNHELFVKVLAQIEREPQTWNQADWGPCSVAEASRPCGTAYCFAGWSVVFAGANHLLDVDYSGRVYANFGSERERVDIAACRVLGIASDPQREDSVSHLFDGGNDKDALYKIAAGELGIDETVLRDKVAAEVSS